LNLKQVRFKKQIDGTNTEKVTVSVTDKEVLTAGDLGKFTSAFQVLNPDQVICRMESSVKFKMDITIVKGRGYVPAEENKPLNAEIGMIPIDSIFTPIKNVKYTVENFRVEQKTDYEKLLLNVVTDGSIHPKEALKEAAKILIYHFALFSDEKITIDLDSKSQSEELDENDLRIRQLLKTKLVDMDLSVRALNCLKAAEVSTLGQLVTFNKNDLLKFRNFGKKSLTEIEDLIKTKGLSFGMTIDKYRLDKE
jgi:DNA-directed RNA polymerase subunit alpha